MARITGTNGNDRLEGTDASDRLYGLGGRDTLDGGRGDDVMDGGSGNDVYFVDSAADAIRDSGGRDTVIALESYYALGAGLENLTLRGEAFEVQGDGNSAANVIRNEQGGAWIDGAGGNDTLLGGGGWDVFSFNLAGNYGRDVVDGGAGNDDGLRVGARSAVVVDFRDGTVSGGGTSGSGSVSFANIEHAAGGAFDDLLIANDAGIRLYGGGGNDTLRGGDGDDRLDSDNDGTDAPPSPLDGGNDRVHGYGGDDVLATGAGNDILDGGSGDDWLDAGAGNDRLYWQASDSRVDGGAGSDRLLLKSGNLDLTGVDNGVIRDIETVDLRGGGDNRLTLAAQDILDLSSTTDTLRVLGRAGDSVNIVGSYTDEGVSGGYHRYSVGAATLLVDTDITSVG
jgi:Ca2+-binding RTX toxin-like protein